MHLFHELHTQDDKDLLIKLLKNKKFIQWESENFVEYWHTARILQGITHPIINKRLFVDSKNNVKIILTNFKTERVATENFEVWINDNISIEDFEIVCNSLLKMVESIVRQDKIPFFRSLPKPLADKMQSDYSKFNTNLLFSHEVDDYFINHKVDCDVPVIDGYEIGNIPATNVDIVLKNWQYGGVEDSKWITSSLQKRPSMGIWDNTTNEMIGQMIYMPSGTYGALIIDERYRGIGLATLLVAGLCKRIKYDEMDFFVEIEMDNVASKSLFKKMNFEQISKSVYMVFVNTGYVCQPGTLF